MLEQLSAFPVLRLHCSFQALDELRLEGFTGSTWHGALGHALMRVSPQAYETLYGSPGQEAGTPRPFALLPDQAGPAPLGFSLTLLGEAVALAPVLVLAVENLAAVGLGNRNIPLRLIRVRLSTLTEGRLGWVEALGAEGPWRGDAPGAVSLADLAARWIGLPADSALLTFDTRLRLKADSGVLKQTPSCDVLLRRLLERVSALSLLYGPGALPSEMVRALLARAREVRVAHSTLRWSEWSRASGRTGQVMPWGGLLGEVAYEGDLAELLPWLALGEWLQVGAKTSFGLGHYRLWAAPG